MSRRLVNDKVNNKRNNKNEIRIKYRFKIAEIFFAIICPLILFLLFLLYGPINNFRDWYITTAMTTMNHKYLAKIFYSDETILKVLENNSLIEFNNISNVNDITFENNQKNNKIYENEYEKQILEKDENNNDYKIIKIDENGLKGYMAVIYEPQRVKTVVTSNLNITGEYITELASKNNALLAINGGGFLDDNFKGTGGVPLGITVTDSKYIVNDNYIGSGGLIGFTKENKLFLGKVDEYEAKAYDVRDGVTFGPFLIINGEKSIIKGNGGWGTAPRTAIGQRKDGIVLFLVLDGRRVYNPGATLADLIDIFDKYGAYNAANLDGGTSTALVVDNVIVNEPTNMSGEFLTRPISTAFILEKDEEDSGDKTVVIDKLK